MARKKKPESVDKEKWFSHFLDQINFMELDPESVLKEACPEWTDSNIRLFLEGGDLCEIMIQYAGDAIMELLCEKEIDFWLFELKGLGINEQEARSRLQCKGWSRKKLYTRADAFYKLISQEKKRQYIDPGFHRLQQCTFQSIINTYLAFFAEKLMPLKQADIADALGVSQAVISKLQKSDTSFQYRYLVFLSNQLRELHHLRFFHYASAYLNYRIHFEYYQRSASERGTLFTKDSIYFYPADPFCHNDAVAQKALIWRENPASASEAGSDHNWEYQQKLSFHKEFEKVLDWLTSLDLKAQELILHAPHLFFDAVDTMYSFDWFIDDLNYQKIHPLFCEFNHSILHILFKLFRESRGEELLDELYSSRFYMSHLLDSEKPTILLHEYSAVQKYLHKIGGIVQIVSEKERYTAETLRTQKARFQNALKNYEILKYTRINADEHMQYITSLLTLKPDEWERWFLYRLKMLLDYGFLLEEIKVYKAYELAE